MESIIELYDKREVRKNIFLNVLDLYVRPALYSIFIFYFGWREPRAYTVFTHIYMDRYGIMWELDRSELSTFSAVLDHYLTLIWLEQAILISIV